MRREGAIADWTLNTPLSVIDESVHLMKKHIRASVYGRMIALRCLLLTIQPGETEARGRATSKSGAGVGT